MGGYANQIESLDLPGLVASVRQQIAGWSVGHRTQFEAWDSGLLDRTDALLDRVLVLGATTTPETVPTDKPPRLANVLEGLLVAVQAVPLTEPTSGYPAVGDAIEALATEMWSWQASTAQDDWRDAVTAAAQTYRRSVGQQLLSVAGNIDDLQTRVEDMRGQLAVMSAALTENRAVVTDTAEEFRVESARRLAEIESIIVGARQQIDSAIARQEQSISTFQDQFSTAQERRNNEFTDLIRDERETLSRAASDLVFKSANKFAELQATIDEAGELVSVFTAAGTANEFGKEANRQDAAANLWRRLAVSVALLATAPAFWLAYSTRTRSVSTGEVIAKLSIALVIAGAASYCATQSKIHRDREVKNRSAALRLASFEPFIRALSDASEQDRARVELLTTIFGPDSPTASNNSDEPIITIGQLSLWQKVFDMISKR
jgi:TolA-binding protein